MTLVLVTGGTGTLGRAVVRQLQEAGQGVRVFSRRPPPAADGPPGRALEWVVGDLVTGTGLAEAVQAVDVVVHCATDGRRPHRDLVAGRRLVAALEAAGRSHLVYISIVGVDQVPMPYYRVKLAVEQLVETSALPWTILRTTQFHDLVAAVFGVSSRLPVLVVPARTSFQPVDVGDVARRLVEVAASPAAGRVADLGGPAMHSAADLARAYLRATRRRRPVLAVAVPGRAAAGFRQGHQLTPNRLVEGRTFAEFLAGREPERPST